MIDFSGYRYNINILVSPIHLYILNSPTFFKLYLPFVGDCISVFVFCVILFVCVCVFGIYKGLAKCTNFS